MTHRVFPCLAVVALCALAACGGDGDGTGSGPDLVPSGNTNEPTSASGDADEAGGSESEPTVAPVTDAPLPVALLSEPTDAAAGFERIPATCEVPADTLGFAGLSYSVPDTWQRAGRTSSGSGGGDGRLDDFVETRFETGDGSATVTFDQDARDELGNILEGDDQWESFDYQIDSSDGSATGVVFTPMFEVAAGDQTVAVLVADQAQAPDLLSTTRHTARVDVADLISYGGPAAGLRRVSFVMSVSRDSSTVALSDDQVAEIFASVAFPDCTWQNELLFDEVVHNIDLNGDGEVATFADLLPAD
jgi:hypothetical protein